MSTHVSTAVWTNWLELSSVANTAMKVSARFWFSVTVIGQLMFAFAVASFYGLTALRGDFHGWTKFISHGYVAGDRMGNFAVAMHIVSAVVIMLAGAVQLVPAVRYLFTAVHRWNGLIYMLTADTLSSAGLYMTWIRGSVGGLLDHVIASLGAVLIWLCAGMALRYALAHDFKSHRRWALRFFLVASASWFFRLMFFLYLLVFGKIGVDPTTFLGPLLTSMSVAQYVIPLAVLEIYLRAQDHDSAPGRIVTAAGLFVLTLAMGVGIFAVSMAVWVPDVKAGFDQRTSIAETLSATIVSSGIDQAEKQYHDLKAAQTAAYNFDEDQLNSLGYRLIHDKKFKEAIRIFQLNVEAYPKSANTYDSLGEGYMDDGNKAEAIVNYQKSIDLNPKNLNGAKILQKLKGP
jgi:tetratricopeptide (TPR) repeat protein